jgi:hypothetical protein
LPWRITRIEITPRFAFDSTPLVGSIVSMPRASRSMKPDRARATVPRAPDVSSSGTDTEIRRPFGSNPDAANARIANIIAAIPATQGPAPDGFNDIEVRTP